LPENSQRLGAAQQATLGSVVTEMSQLRIDAAPDFRYVP
jgi:hypothetical protein